MTLKIKKIYSYWQLFSWRHKNMAWTETGLIKTNAASTKATVYDTDWITKN